ncbi:MAG: nuclear transport factor 2 family protein [Candidatus Parvarchaeota archaeon]|nr:nuclear transport factor 2 family protein [Candidatus Parvarchaeota archaeon]
MVTLKEAKVLLKKYAEAWMKRDPDAIVRIFAPNAEYKETAFDRPPKGHKGIRKYWVDKVMGQEKDIKFKLLNVYVQGNNVTAEWYAQFYDTINQYHIKMKEVALFKVRNGKIYNYREYWSSKHYR